MNAVQRIALLAIVGSLAVLGGCGGGSGSTSVSKGTSTPATVNNVQPIIANAGPAGAGGYVNGVFTSVTICVPGSSSCQAIDNVLVDTGSEGLRILSSVLTIALPQVNDASNTPIVECNQFLDGYTWGPVRVADIKLAGEQASSIPVQSIGDAAYPTVPSTCSSSGPSEGTLATLGANGILGVGPWRQDCGGACAVVGSSNAGLYYTCPSSGSCTQASVPLAKQLQNPVWMFASDNNGVVIELPSIPDTGAPSAIGSMIFGIGTQSNNSLGSAKVLGLDNTGSFTTTYNGKNYSGSFIDTGSNGYFFLDSSTTGIPLCSGNANQFYCPASMQTLTATNVGVNSVSSTVTFKIGNATQLFANTADFEYDDLGGPGKSNFDWGLPFFFGRNVFTGIEGQSSPGGVGPYFAY